MKKNYLWSYSLVALFLLFTACNTSPEDEAMPASNEVNVEPDFFEKDGSIEESDFEEEAPTGAEAKTYGYYNYTLLKPSELSQEKIDAMCGEETSMPLLVGSRKKKVGEVKVMNDDENLYLTFSADQYKYMKKVYLNIGAKGSTPFYSNGFPNLRKFNFKAFPYYFGGQKKATYTIPLSSIDADCFEIVAYSKVYDAYSRCFYTSFAYDKNLTQKYSYSYYSGCYYYNEWVRSFEYCKQDCKVEEECIEAIAFHPECGRCTNFNNNTHFVNKFGYIEFRDRTAYIDLFVGNEDCDLSNSTKVGNIIVDYDESTSTFDVKYVLDEGYKLCEITFSAGGFEWDESNVYQKSFDSDVTQYSFKIPKATETFNIAYIEAGAKVSQ